MTDDAPRIKAGRRKEDVTADWIRAHEESDRAIHESFQRAQEDTLTELRGLRDDLKPVVAIYQATSLGGRAFVKFVGFLAVLAGLALALIKLVKSGSPS